MTSKEKAKKLIDLFYQLFPLDKYVSTTDGELNWEYNNWNQSKQCALIAVEEIINALDIDCADDEPYTCAKIISDCEYWEKVKQEISNL